jgi:hypothetical protein
MNDDGDDDAGRRRPRSSASASAEITLLVERQRGLMKRVDELEKKQGEVSSLMNKGIGAMALLMGAGAVIGWLVSVGGNVVKLFR